MNNEADSGHFDSVELLERQNNSEATPLDLTPAGLSGDQIGRSQNFPIMLFEIQADVVARPVTARSDRLI